MIIQKMWSIVERKNLVSDEYRRMQDLYLSFLRQKFKAQWIDKGDDNTRLFHQSIKARRCSNKIHSIQDSNGQWVNSREKVNEAFVKFYTKLLGKQMHDRCKVKQLIFDEGTRVNKNQRS